jgi:hypothetical protein
MHESTFHCLDEGPSAIPFESDQQTDHGPFGATGVEVEHWERAICVRPARPNAVRSADPENMISLVFWDLHHLN